MDVSDAAPTIHLVGDSTMATIDPAGKDPQRGWGQFVAEFFQAEVRVINYAAGGRSTKSFRDEKRWEKVMEALQPGDWVVIQFGHNDQKKELPEHYAPAATDYAANLRRYVEEARGKGAEVVLATSIYRWRFKEGETTPHPTLRGYPEATREVAGELGLVLVDLQELTGAELARRGPEGSQEIYLFIAPGTNPDVPEGMSDRTHLSEYGARLVAGMFAQSLREQNAPLARWLRPRE